MQKKKYTLLIFFIILCIIGIAVIPRLSFQLNPNVESRSIVINCRWSKVSPIAMEQQVTSVIEGACATLQNIKKITSYSGNGYGSVILQLEKNTDPNYLRFEVATLMRQLYQQLPKGVSYPQVSMKMPAELSSNQALMVWQLNGNSSDVVLQEKAETILKPALSQIQGVAEVNVQGAGENEWILNYKNEQLQALNIDEYEIVEAINQHFSVENLGKSTTNEGKEINISLKNYHKNETDWNEIIIGKRDKRVIYLKDIVSIEKKISDPNNYYRINGKNAINITILAEKKANQIALAAAIIDKIAILEKLLPKNFHLVLDYDASENIKENLEKIADQILLALLILIVFVWISSWSWRYTLVVTTGLIVNILLCNIVFFAFKIELHLYSLAALTTSLGIVIDNTIVMIDYFKRYKNLRIFTALLGATLTTLAGLSVVLFLPETNRIILQDFAFVFTIALLMSLFVSLLFVPVFHSFLSKKNPQEIAPFKRKKRLQYFNKLYLRFITFTLRFKKTFIFIIVLIFGIPFGIIPDKIEGKTTWIKTYNTLMDTENTQYTLGVLQSVFGGTLSLFLNDVYEKSYYADPERTALHINVGLPNNSTIEQMNQIFVRLEYYLKNQPQLDKYITNIYNGQEAEMTVFFKKEYENTAYPFMLKNKIVNLSTEMSGINCDIYGVGEGFSVKTDEDETPSYTIKLQGYNHLQLEKLALSIKQRLEKFQRIQKLDINGNGRKRGNKKMYEFQLLTNSKAIVQNNFDQSTLYNALRQQNQLADIDTYINTNGKYIPVKVLPDDHKNFDIWQLNNESALKQNKKNKQARVKLADIATLTKQKIASDIVKENQQYIRNITFEYIGSSTRGDKIVDQAIEIEKQNYPIGYTIERETHGNWDKKNKQQYWLIGLVIVLIYIICAIIFENLLQPLALILLIPISYIGVFITFSVFEFNFDQGGYAAFILLSGNVVCAAIFIISEYNLIRQTNSLLSPIRLYLKAFNHKIYPIVLTIISTIVGLIPFLIYGQKEAFWFSLGAGTIGGLLMSMIAIFVFLPLFLIKKSNIELIPKRLLYRYKKWLN